MARLAIAVVIVTAIVAATFLPFAAGGHDFLALPVAMIAWALGRVGLLLVPVGGFLLAANVINPSRAISSRWLAGYTLGTCILMSLLMVFIAFASSGSILFAAGAVAIAGFLNVRLIRYLRTPRSESSFTSATATLLIIAPVLLFALQSMLLEPIATFARNRAIANCDSLIDEIERHHARNGVYPESLFSIWGDCKPAIVGVERYYYERSGDAYNVIFREPSLDFGTRRYIVYNPRDKQRVTVHEQDRLRLDEAGLSADNAGYTLIQQLPQPHWKAFLFLS
jgi:hypothetical protein